MSHPPRIPYLSDAQAGPADLVRAIRERRGGTLLNLDRMLLHSPPFARGWNAHLAAVRSELSLSAKLRELVICAVAVLNGAEYEYAQHVGPFLAAGGTAEAAEALRQVAPGGADETLFDEREQAALALAREMTRGVAVRDATFARVRRALPDDRQLVELVGVIATYNMVSRFLEALHVGLAGEREAG